MTTTTEAKLLAAGDLLRLDAKGVRGELIRGVLCGPMPAGQRHGKTVARLVSAASRMPSLGWTCCRASLAS